MLDATARIETFEGAGYAWLLVETLAILAIIALVAWVVLRALGARGARNHGPIRILARQMLEPRRALYLISVGDKVWLVGSSEGAMSTLAELDEPTAASLSQEAAAPSDFASRLAAKLLARGWAGSSASGVPVPGSKADGEGPSTLSARAQTSEPSQ